VTSVEIRAIILDSPVLDWPATFEYGARRHGIPEAAVAIPEQFVAWRAGIDYAQFDQLRHEHCLRVPILLVQGDADTVVPASLAAKFASGRPDLITYLPVHGADHVSANGQPGQARSTTSVMERSIYRRGHGDVGWRTPSTHSAATHLLGVPVFDAETVPALPRMDATRCRSQA
jgi:fermentation-respiration switch protein FrsA (DUF1100 family)